MGIKTFLHCVFMNISFRSCIITISILFTYNFIFQSITIEANTYAQNKDISESSTSSHRISDIDSLYIRVSSTYCFTKTGWLPFSVGVR